MSTCCGLRPQCACTSRTACCVPPPHGTPLFTSETTRLSPSAGDRLQCTDANPQQALQPSFTPRRSGGRKESASNITVGLCACARAIDPSTPQYPSAHIQTFSHGGQQSGVSRPRTSKSSSGEDSSAVVLWKSLSAAAMPSFDWNRYCEGMRSTRHRPGLAQSHRDRFKLPQQPHRLTAACGSVRARCAWALCLPHCASLSVSPSLCLSLCVSLTVPLSLCLPHCASLSLPRRGGERTFATCLRRLIWTACDPRRLRRGERSEDCAATSASNDRRNASTWNRAELRV
jgi:hypothetical protein